jgi:hypothetical protein
LLCFQLGLFGKSAVHVTVIVLGAGKITYHAVLLNNVTNADVACLTL